MHKRLVTSGFTIVELVVVVTVIVILATISILGYETITEQSNDAKRNSDITALQHELENYFQEHGEYPAGCPALTCATGRTDVVFNNSTPQLNSDATLADMRTVLPGLADDFGDPLSEGSYPLLDEAGENTVGSAYRYIYFGGLVNTTGSTQNYTYEITGPYFNCNASVSLGPRQVSNYFLAYYSEQDNPNGQTPSQDRWHVINGAHGQRIRLPLWGSTDYLFCDRSTDNHPWTGGSVDN